MPSLGDFTAIMAEADDDPTTFDLAGETFTLQPEISAYAFLKFSALVGEIDITDEDQLGAINMVVMFDVLRDAIIPEHWDRFERTVRASRAPVSALVRLVAAIQGGATGRPTEAPSGSGGAVSSTSRKSNGKRSKSSATKSAMKKSTTAKRSATARRIEEARRAEEMVSPSEADSAALGAALGLPVVPIGSTGSRHG